MQEHPSSIQIVREHIEPHYQALRGRFYSLQIDEGENEIALRGQSTEVDITRFTMLRVVTNDDGRHIYIPNIIKPKPVTERGVGRALIAAIYTAAYQLGYRLFIVDLVAGFNRKLLEWGAIQRGEDTVEITQDTVLHD
jgi:predicted GNAT superfamily acetyltransferase